MLTFSKIKDVSTLKRTYWNADNILNIEKDLLTDTTELKKKFVHFDSLWSIVTNEEGKFISNGMF